MKTRETYHHGDLRRALIDAGRAEVAARGAPAFSLRGVATHLGVDPAAVYRHFRDKADLLGAVAAEGFVRLADEMVVRMHAAATPLGQLQATGRGYVAFARQDPATFRLMFGPKEVARLPEACLPPRTPHQLLVDALTALHAHTPLRLPPEAAVLPCWSAVHGLAALVIDGRVDPSLNLDAAADLVVDAVLVGLLDRGPRA